MKSSLREKSLPFLYISFPKCNEWFLSTLLYWYIALDTYLYNPSITFMCNLNILTYIYIYMQWHLFFFNIQDVLYIYICESESRSVQLLWPHGLHSPWNSPVQNTGVGILSLLQVSSQPRDWTQVSHITDGFFTSWATRKALCIFGHTIWLMRS